MRHARRDRGERTAEQRLDRAMVMAEGQGLHLRVGAHDGFEALGALEEPDLVHMADAAVEGRVMREDQGRLAALRRERLVEPGETLFA